MKPITTSFAACAALLLFALACVTAGAQTAPGTVDASFAASDAENIARHRGAFFQARGSALAAQADGKILVAGECLGGTSAEPFCVARFNADGSVDTAFGSGGIASTNFAGAASVKATSVAVQDDGRILLVGLCTLAFDANGPDGRPCFARFLQNGSLESSPIAGGRVIRATTRRFQGDAVGVVMRPGGRFYVAGTCVVGTAYRICVMSYLADGTPDGNFLGGGERDSVYFEGATPYSTVFQSMAASRGDDGVLIAGNCGSSSGTSMCVTKVTNSGGTDTSFAGGGFARVSIGLVAYATSVLQQFDGKVAVAGSCTEASGFLQTCVARFNANGSIDNTFANAGRSILTLSSFTGTEARGLVQQNDGKLLAYSYCETTQNSPQLCVVRYEQSGQLDTSFGNLASGIARQTYPQFSEFRGQILMPDGKLVIAGTCSLDICVRRTVGGPFPGKQCTLDIDGDGVHATTTDSIIATRVSLGFNGSRVTDGLSLATQATRRSWPVIRDYLVNQCGLQIAP